MGVSGSGKTTLGLQLSEKLGLEFYDGDHFHSETNIAKMSAGNPLTDEDRFEWLESINEAAQKLVADKKSGIFACSALKEKYRILLSKNIENEIVFVYLKGTKDVIQARMNARKGHFMPSQLLDSQFNTLEEPQNAHEIDLTKSPEEMIQETLEKISLSEFGLVGLGVMGKSLARNLANNGVQLSLFNRFVEDKEVKVAEKFIESHDELNSAKGFEDLEKFCKSLQTPRKIFLMIKAGVETDEFIEKIKPYLQKGDILIDGGNSHFKDTKRRMDYLAESGLHFIGTGVSGGEEGALKGPSIMPSGDAAAYKNIERFLNKIAAKDKNGGNCCTYIGPDGSGHFIKMVHNGVEYAEMQQIAEVYALLRYKNGLNPDEISEIFHQWNAGELKSYLLEISAKILTKKENEKWLIDIILDQAGNKGTGNWTTVTATEMGIPATLITSALFARYVSTVREKYLNVPSNTEFESKPLDLGIVAKAYALARILNHQQGFGLIKTVSDEYNWSLNLSEIARIWTNGCIIRSTLMENIQEYFESAEDLFDVIEIKQQIVEFKGDLKRFCIAAMEAELPIPCMISANDYINTLNQDVHTANMIQAQRDFFGAHTYQRIDAERGKFFHTIWE
ncbi:NADP-dependent phosphogluconate dehydrogenase [Lacihabitans soyangensis]|uniref:6-phosphogluconate dehydrogenase, decarboxylating n=2 Tax=Lacihabitans soyangensis TaxID=869394 RepID=A0AAE3GYE7_9BACT|nr:NADP-dependent phosphogluconate dehydrogenase [Lacihabitans soyangensis]